MEELERRIDEWMERHLPEMLTHIKELIRIPSIAKDAPGEEHPFGNGCADALDYVLMLAEALGFSTRNYDYYGGSARLPGRTGRTIGFFAHLDTTPAGAMWTFQPFNPIVRDGYIIGRGAEDNKGAAVMILYMLRCLRDLEILLDHTILVVFGCGKKSRMKDMDYILRREPAPDLSLIADANFPVCTGEKGSLNFELSCPAGGRLIDFHAGLAESMVPHQAFALLDGVPFEEARKRLEQDSRCSIVPAGPYVKIAAGGLGGHAAFPEKTHSPIPVLASVLLDNGLADGSCTHALRYLRDTYGTCFGAPFDLDVRDETYGYTTHVCGMVRMRGGVLYQTVNVRYIPPVDPDKAERLTRRAAERAGMVYRKLNNAPPRTLEPRMQPIAAMLTSISNRVTGRHLHEYTMGGGTYAKKLPNALPFGPNRSDLPMPFGEGRGYGHLPDEVMRIENLTDGLKIYVLSLLRLDPLV